MDSIKRGFVAGVFGISLSFFIVPNAVAQQVTAPTIPNTQNPQSARTNIVENNNDVQQSSDASLLNNARQITIPEGEPVQAADGPAKSRGSIHRGLQLLVGLLGVLVAIVVIRIAGRPTPDHAPAATIDTVTTKTPHVSEDPKAEKTKKSTAQTTKKKKRRSKSKKKK